MSLKFSQFTAASNDDPDVQKEPLLAINNEDNWQYELESAYIHDTTNSSRTERFTSAFKYLINPKRLWFIIGFGCFFVLSFSYHSFTTRVRPLDSDNTNGRKENTTWFAPREIQTQWAMYAPYYPVEAYKPPPEGCSVDQVHILQRHGARYPTFGAAIRIAQAYEKIKSATHFTDPKLSFWNEWEYDLGVDDLVPFGALQSRQAGEEAANRYPSLNSSDNLPFIRASSGQRVVDSALFWASGWQHVTGHIPPLAVIISESGNNTLDAKMCPNAPSPDPYTSVWTKKFAKRIAKRVNHHALIVNAEDGTKTKNIDLKSEDIYALLTLCAFDTVHKETLSPVCGMFDAKKGDFSGEEYVGDLDKFYGTGYGSPLGPVQGVGYINELLARLTGSPVNDSTQTNRTLDEDPATFPLDRSVYVDFSHDNEMVAIYAGLGIFKGDVHDSKGKWSGLDPKHPKADRNWVVSAMVPFSGRMVVERLACHTSSSSADNGKVENQYIRIFVNDAMQPLDFCRSAKDAIGMCALKSFVESQWYARSGGNGDWEKCRSRKNLRSAESVD